jgi:hypothetical protein
MLRHKWFIILIALQILNFAGMALFEQQRRSIWNKEAAHTQQMIDTRLFAEKTEANYLYAANLIAGLDLRITSLQSEAAKNTHNAALLADLQARVTALQSEAGNNAGNAGLIKETRDRVVNLESSLQKLQSDK